MSKNTPGNPAPRHQFESGAMRDSKVAGESGTFPLRFDLLLSNVSFMKRMAAVYGEGAIKYGDDNWRLGMPQKSLVNHLMAHLIQHIAGDRTEDHLGHMTWNAMTLMWLEENRPDLMDLTALAAKGTKPPELQGCNSADSEPMKEIREEVLNATVNDAQAAMIHQLCHKLNELHHVKRFSVGEQEAIVAGLLHPTTFTLHGLQEIRDIASHCGLL